jgi:transposase-like protein
MVSFKGAHFEPDIILTCVHWYVPYPLSYRQLEEFMQERDVAVDHATINRWVLKYAPLDVSTDDVQKCAPTWQCVRGPIHLPQLSRKSSTVR